MGSSAQHLPVPNRVPVLDGIRGLAILMVLLCHFALYGGMEPAGMADWFFLKLTLPLGCGVELFFVLSGFLITGILLDTKEAPGYFRNFYMRRVLRIVPLYYGVLVFFYVVLPRMMPPGPAYDAVLRDQWWDWTYLSNVRLANEGWPRVGYLGHFWTLAIEEQFYLVWPLVVLLFPRRRLLVICAALVATSLAIRWNMWFTDTPMMRDHLTYARLDTLVVGAALAAFARGPRGLKALRPWAWVAGGGALLGVVHLLTSEAYKDPEHVVARVFLQTLFALVFGSLLVLAVTAPSGSRIQRLLSSRWLVLLGVYSYGLYVFHLPLIVYAGTHGFGAFRFPTVLGSRLPGLAVVMAVSGVAIAGAAVLSYHLYELRFLRLKRFFEPRAEPRSASPGSRQPVLPVDQEA